ncbi:tropomyosin isoform X6 [Aethina tumida]|uniref:tropomyosin isoform X6 n=1 Tax=Aethina tumida TaxID=116153 RepID=UPI00214740C6|nr:tropomyosin isoform X6 [Aethina tumida]
MSATRAQGNIKKRGHQHHPRNEGNRRRPALENNVDSNPPLSVYSKENVVTVQENKTTPNPHVISSACERPSTLDLNVNNKPKCDTIEVIDLTNCDDDAAKSDKLEKVDIRKSIDDVVVTKTIKDERNQKLRKPKTPKEKANNIKTPEQEDMSLVFRPAAEGSSLSDQECEETRDDDPEVVELSKLRCTSERTEVVAERETRRRNRRCADYPGLAFASSIFSSDTLMKFSIIRNELHNIMNTQLKRAESEVAALNRRIQLLEEDLERSEERLATATAKLAEASAAADESERIRKALENRTNMEDDRVSILESQLAQAKQIAEEADKKYEEVARKLVLMEQDLERAEERAEANDSKIVELEEELRVVGNNLKSLEVSEEKATAKEEEYSVTLKQVEQRLHQAEARAEFAERSVQKLQKEVDRLEDDLLAEKEKNKVLADEMEATLHDIQNM